MLDQGAQGVVGSGIHSAFCWGFGMHISTPYFHRAMPCVSGSQTQIAFSIDLQNIEVL